MINVLSDEGEQYEAIAEHGGQSLAQIEENRMKNKLAILVLGAAAMLAACGSNDVTPIPPATSGVPASASASIDGFIAYLNLLVTSAADTLEPVDVSALTPPTDEKSEPLPVN